MSARIVPCDSCGSPIRDSELETGQAVTLLGKKYCGACKGEAIQKVSLDDLSGAPAPSVPAPVKKAAAAPRSAAPAAPKPAPAAVPSAASKPAPAPAPAPPPTRTDRKPPARRPAPAPSPASRTPLIAGIAGAAAVLIAVGTYFGLRGSPMPPPPSPKGSTAGPASSTAPPAKSPEDKARQAFAQVQELAARSGSSYDLLLAAGEKARGTCKGTSFEKPLEDLIAGIRRDKESEESARDLAPLIDELKGAVATDSEFKRYSELQPKFQLAIETAAKSGSSRVNEIRLLQSDYNTRYEKLAEPYYNDIHEAAVALADERRYDDAIRKIDTFPQQFRNSGTWTTLQKLRQDIERRKKK
jgi:hypothetical protein